MFAPFAKSSNDTDHTIPVICPVCKGVAFNLYQTPVQGEALKASNLHPTPIGEEYKTGDDVACESCHRPFTPQEVTGVLDYVLL